MSVPVVKRYSPKMEEFWDGDWVSFTDYAKLQDEMEAMSLHANGVSMAMQDLLLEARNALWVTGNPGHLAIAQRIEKLLERK